MIVPNDIVGIQGYFQDEWVNTTHTMESLEKDAKKYGGKLESMYVSTSWFEHETVYYIDNMGHTCLYRIIDTFNKSYWTKNIKKGTMVKVGGKGVSLTTME